MNSDVTTRNSFLFSSSRHGGRALAWRAVACDEISCDSGFLPPIPKPTGDCVKRDRKEPVNMHRGRKVERERGNKWVEVAWTRHDGRT